MSGSYHQNPSSGTWYARVNGARDADGKRSQIRLKGSTKREVQVAVAKLLLKLQSGYDHAKGKTDMAALFEMWLATKQDVEFRTIESYKSTIRLHLTPLLGKFDVTKIKRAQIQAAVEEWREGKRKDAKLGKRGARTIRENLRVLKAVLDLAVIDGLRQDNPARFVKAPKLTKPVRQFTTAEGAAAILCAAFGTLLYAALYVAFAAGLRRGEIVALQRKDVDLYAGILSVRRAIACRGKSVKIKTPKTASGVRDIPIPAGLLTALKSHIRDQDERFELLGITSVPETYLFDRYDGGLWHPDAFGKAYRALLKTNGLPKLRLHGTRHSFASIGLAEGVQTKVMSQALGHESELLTLSVYSHVEESSLRNATTKIDDAISRSIISRKLQALSDGNEKE